MKKESFRIIDHNKDSLRITLSASLQKDESLLLRNEIENLLNSEYELIYIDASEVISADLAGINEIIHSFHHLEKVDKKLVFVYKQSSEIEKWVQTTGLNKFIETAILPAS